MVRSAQVVTVRQPHDDRCTPIDRGLLPCLKILAPHDVLGKAGAPACGGLGVALGAFRVGEILQDRD